MVSALTTQAKPNSIEWDDFEMRWIRLNNQDKRRAMRDFVVSLGGASLWILGDANEMTKWDNRITVVD